MLSLFYGDLLQGGDGSLVYGAFCIYSPCGCCARGVTSLEYVAPIVLSMCTGYVLQSDVFVRLHELSHRTCLLYTSDAADE